MFILIKFQFYPAVGQAYDDMVKTGYDAMMNWSGQYPKVGPRRPNYEALVVLWTLKAIELAGDFIISTLKIVFVLLVTLYRVKVA
jgi:hypothetical protein